MPIDPRLAVGVDVSVHNGTFNPSKSKERIDFVIARSNIGSRRDLNFDRNYQVSMVHGLPFMAYNQSWATTPWRTQADVTLSATTGKDVLGIWWAWDGAGGNKLTKQFALDSVSAMSYLRQQTGKLVGVYGNRTELAQLYAWAPAARAFPVWFANYRATSAANIAYWKNTVYVQPITKPEFPNGLQFLVWQFASEKNWLGFDTGHDWGLESWSVDLNVWNGTPAEMRAYLGLFSTQPTPPPLTLEERMDAVEKRLDALERG